MTNELTIILMLMFIGAIIGGGTNVIAIRMLFRPFKAINIGSVRLPFTPGLIPKRRGEIAESLGKTVEEHLVTPEGIQEKLKDGLLLKEMEDRLSSAINELLQEERTLDQWLEEHLDGKDQLGSFRQSVESGLQAKLMSWFYDYKDRPVNEWMPKSWQNQVKDKIPLVADNILWKTEEYLESEEGIKQMDQMVRRFFQSKGSVTSMFGKMAHRFSLSSALSKEIIRFLRESHTKELLTSLLVKEWEASIAKSPSEYVDDEWIEKKVESLSMSVVGNVPIVGEWGQPLHEWSKKYEMMIQQTILPSIMASASLILSRYIKSMIKKIGIREIVVAEVNQFPLSRLEQMLLMIAKRELKLIAVLGALIGAIVGLFQGMFIVFFT
ncbi:DUF445 domain-containing protein [Salipaludibacillus daqingensis]|uniref:DUF445 domain-containing protein n=1 Tax=Salipaludibacillus daqingensis TaxID=3041001 RepID=UPI002474606D|nr:DUF445 family protein [Salipaludibacillus daqingensis]